VTQVRFEGEALPRPVARDAQSPVLIGDAAVVDLLPLPDTLHELFAAQVLAGDALLAQFSLHHVLGGDAGVVGAGQIEGLVAPHAVVAGHHVLDGGRHGVAQVERAGDVGQRHGDAPVRAVLGDQAQFDASFGPKVTLFLPPLIDAFFVILGIINLG